MGLFKVGLVAFAMAGIMALVNSLPSNGTVYPREAAAEPIKTFPVVPGESECRCGPGCECESCSCAKSFTAAESPGTPQIEPGWTRSIYAVRVTGSDGIGGGACAIAVERDLLHTVSHITHKIPQPWRWEVEVDGRWRPAVARASAGKDLAAVRVAGVQLNPVEIRHPEYGERVTVYGARTRSMSQGVYIGEESPGAGHVALESGETPVESGDSGGGIFADDGCLVGTITGRRVNVPLVTAMTPIVKPRDVQTSFVSTEVPDILTAKNCPGGVCQSPQVQQAFFQPSRKGFFGRRK